MFKAILFLCAGVVIHGVGGTQDIRAMGLIWKIRPFIRILISLANLSLAGFPFLRGFYSKDIILELIYTLNTNFILLIMLTFSTVFTVTYSLRLRYYCIWRGVITSPFQNYRESTLIVYPIFFIGGLVVFLGGALSWILFPEPIFIHLRFLVKIINLCLVILGFWFFAIQFNYVWRSRESGNITIFLGSIWFLPLISGSIFSKINRSTLVYHLSSDQGWIESIGAQGVFSGISNLAIHTRSTQFSGLNFLVKLLFLILLIVLFFYLFSLLKT